MLGYITSKQEFLFPDSPLGSMPDSLRTVSCQNGKAGIQILLSCPQGAAQVRIGTEQFTVEYFRMIPIPVEYNTGNGVDQGGAMVILKDTRPDYAIRKAPFWVYDCLQPLESGDVEPQDGVAAIYITLSAKEGTPAGEYEIPVCLTVGEESRSITICHRVYPVSFDENLFHQTNWYSIDAMERMHHVQQGTPEFEEVFRAYLRSMRRVHQKTIEIPMYSDMTHNQEDGSYHFSFEKMKPLIQIAFEEGFDTLQTGGLLDRGTRPDGTWDAFTADFKCGPGGTILVDSDEGYKWISSKMRDFSAFLRENGWDKKVLFSIHDEPDVHYKTEEAVQTRRLQYFQVANIVRRYLPSVKILEAVKTTKFRGGVDAMCPVTDGYEKNKKAFDEAIALGDEVWAYVCCGPQGKWLNRFLDSPLINGRLLLWGCESNRISGYLHWGWNQFAGVPDPFKATSCYNSTGLGTNFPCGDAFIVYPGEKGPWLSMRLEAERVGAEEACLLKVLRQKDPAAHDALVKKVFTGFKEYNNDPDNMEMVHEELLQMLS